MNENRPDGPGEHSHRPARAGAQPRLAVIAGDGIGHEVIAEALKVLDAASPPGAGFSATHYNLGAERYLTDGQVLSDGVLVPLQATFALLIVSALVMIRRRRWSWACRFRHAM